MPIFSIDMEVGTGVRIDKWLWAVRLFKTRALASAACEEGKILMQDKAVKASRIVRAGDRISVKRTGLTIRVEVLRPIDKRVGAKMVTENCKDLTPSEDIEAYRTRATRMTIYREPGTGRPTKKERRALDDFLSPFDEYPEE